MRKINLTPQQRKTGFLFQHYALFPAMSLRRNLEIVLQHKDSKTRKRLADEMLEKLQLTMFAGHKPPQLSGGQQQRAAMGRILLSSPDIILLDEPFSSLDTFLKLSVEEELMNILSQFSGTILFVSHNRDEIFRICQRIAVLEHGTLSVIGETREIFQYPVTAAAARLTGCKNVASTVARGQNEIFVPDWGLTLQTKQETFPGLKYAAIRAHHIREAAPDDQENCFEFTAISKQNEPFRVQELLTLYHDGEMPVTPLIRFISGGDSSSLLLHDSTPVVKRYCIPAEYIMLLR
jgi:molybdate transport system ATP-binding protein